MKTGKRKYINKYEILDEEIRNLEDRPKMFFIDLGKALVNMNEKERFRTGGFNRLASYIHHRTSFSPQKDRALRGLYNLFRSMLETSRLTPYKKWLGRFVLTKAGWSKSRVLKNKKDKYMEAVDIGLLDFKEVLLYASFKTRDDLIDDLELYSGHELWLKIYCDVYFPELLKNELLVVPAYLVALSKTAERMSENYETDFFTDFIDDELTELSLTSVKPTKDGKAFRLLLNLRKVERRLTYLSELMGKGKGHNPFLYRLEQNHQEITDPQKVDLESFLTTLVAWGPENISSIGSYGTHNLAKILETDIDTIDKWQNSYPSDISIPLTKQQSPETDHCLDDSYEILIFEPKFESDGSKYSRKTNDSKRGDNKLFTLEHVVKGIYLKAFLEDGNSFRDSAEAVRDRMSLIHELGLITPYLSAVRRVLKVLTEKETEIPPPNFLKRNTLFKIFRHNFEG